MKVRKILVFALVLCIVTASVLTGCTETTDEAAGNSSGEATTGDSGEATTVDSGSADSGTQDEGGESGDAELAEIYKLTPATSLSGVIGPNLQSRADIDKAWPKTPADPNKIVIGWTEITMGNPWFVAMMEAAQAKADEYGFVLDVLVADGSVEKQSEHIDSFITKGVDIIVVDPCDVLGPVNDIKRAVEAGIPVVGMGTVMDSSAPILTTVCLNPFEVGYACGEYTGNSFDADEQINLAVIIGVMGNSTSESRICGGISGIVAARQKAMGTFTTKEDAMLIGYYLFDDIKKTGKCNDPDLKISCLGWGDGNWTEEGGLAAAEDILTANGDKLNLIIACNDFEGAGALKAVKARGLEDQIEIANFADGSREGLQLVKDGEMLCTGTFAGPAFGAGTIEFIKQIFIDGKDPSNLPMGTYSPVDVINRENMDEYWDPDPSNPFYILPEFEFPKSIPEIIADFKE